MSLTAFGSAVWSIGFAARLPAVVEVALWVVCFGALALALYADDRRAGGTLKRAIAIAEKAHQGQVDKGGAPYIQHPLRVMARVHTEDEKIAAVLHDVVEDGGASLDALRREGFPERVIAAVDALTRRPGESYEDFVARAAANDIARNVKLADLFDNCDLSRIPNPTPADYERLRKYQRAISEIRRRYEPPREASVRATWPDLPLKRKAGSTVPPAARKPATSCWPDRHEGSKCSSGASPAPRSWVEESWGRRNASEFTPPSAVATPASSSRLILS